MSFHSLPPSRLVLALVAAGLLGGAGATFVNTRHAHASAPPGIAGAPAGAAAGQPAPVHPATAAAAAGAPDFAQIARQQGPAVVNITVSGLRSASDDAAADDDARSGARRAPEDPFLEFFRRFQGPGGGDRQALPVSGQGSGFIVSADGLILTNAHVVRDARDVTVKLTDRREFQARVLGADPKTDVAVLKIDAHDLPVARLGSARTLEVGQWVLAIGSPFGFENSVSAGVVSAKGRSLPDDSLVPFIQTDVAVNPGNSGGPLFDTRGEVIGINAQIYSRTGGYQGLSFAIPIDVATRVMQQIVATGHARHARLGVSVQEVNQALAESFRLQRPEGALVAHVEKGSPADRAGLLPGDVIQRVDGQPIVASGDLPAVIGQAAPGKTITLGIWRQGQPAERVARLGDADAHDRPAARVAPASDHGRLGLALRPLAPEEKQSTGVDAGLVIAQVSGAAALAGVHPGDVLLSVNGLPVGDVQQVRAAMTRADRSVALLVQRDGARIFVPIRLG